MAGFLERPSPGHGKRESRHRESKEKHDQGHNDKDDIFQVATSWDVRIAAADGTDWFRHFVAKLQRVS